MGLKKEYRIFFAIPFDTATKDLYKYIENMIREKYLKITVIKGL